MNPLADTVHCEAFIYELTYWQIPLASICCGFVV